MQVWGPRYQVYVVAEPDLAVFTLARLPDSGKTRAAAEELRAAPPRRARRRTDARRRRRAGDGRARQQPPLRDPDRARSRSAGRAHAHRTSGPFRRRRSAAGGARRARAPLPPHLRAVDGGRVRQVGRDRAPRKRQPRSTSSPRSWSRCGRPSATRICSPPTRQRSAERRARGAGAASAERRRLLAARHARRSARSSFPDEKRRGELWTPRVWPGAVLVDGEIVGTWRRAKRVLHDRAPGRGSRASHGRPSSPRPRGCRCPTRGRPSFSSRDEDADRPCDRQPGRRRQAGLPARAVRPAAGRRRDAERRRRRGRRSPTRASTSCATTTPGRPARPPSRWSTSGTSSTSRSRTGCSCGSRSRASTTRSRTRRCSRTSSTRSRGIPGSACGREPTSRRTGTSPPTGLVAVLKHVRSLDPDHPLAIIEAPRDPSVEPGGQDRC